MEEFYTVNQAAIILKVHQLTLRRYIKEGKLKAHRVGGNVRISQNDLRDFTQNFIQYSKTTKSPTRPSAVVKSFTFGDSLFMIKGKGLNINEIE